MQSDWIGAECEGVCVCVCVCVCVHARSSAEGPCTAGTLSEQSKQLNLGFICSSSMHTHTRAHAHRQTDMHAHTQMHKSTQGWDKRTVKSGRQEESKRGMNISCVPRWWCQQFGRSGKRGIRCTRHLINISPSPPLSLSFFLSPPFSFTPSHPGILRPGSIGWCRPQGDP